MGTMGSGCGSVGRAFASKTRGRQFKSSHWQNLWWTFVYLFTINCIEKTKKDKKRPGMAHFFKKNMDPILWSRFYFLQFSDPNNTNSNSNLNNLAETSFVDCSSEDDNDDLTPRQCDQIERFLKVLSNKVSYKSSPNVWQIFGLFWKLHFLKKLLLKLLFGISWKFFGYFYSNVWSHCI